MKKKCIRCGEDFTTIKAKSRYCEKCRDIANKEARLRASQNRTNKNIVHIECMLNDREKIHRAARAMNIPVYKYISTILP